MNEPQWNGGLGIERDAGRYGDWAQTYTGKRFYIADPRPQDVDLLDIAVALGNLCRYTGNIGRHYSVAEHSVLVSHLVPREDALCGLLHDAAEYVLADPNRPVKRTLGRDNEYFRLEQRIWKGALAPKFNLPDEFPDSVKHADTQICIREKAVLMPRSDVWQLPYEDPVHLPISCWSARRATDEFLYRFQRLGGCTRSQLSEELERLHELREQDERAFQSQGPQ
jgi:hypothetical protein